MPAISIYLKADADKGCKMNTDAMTPSELAKYIDYSMPATAYCFECMEDQPAEAYDSNPESCYAFVSERTHRQWRTGAHMVGFKCLTCGTIEAEPCVHD